MAIHHNYGLMHRGERRPGEKLGRQDGGRGTRRGGASSMHGVRRIIELSWLSRSARNVCAVNLTRQEALALLEQLCRDLPSGDSPAAYDFDYGWFWEPVGALAGGGQAGGAL